ncbi:hypothetical protein HanXRQr2_Chr04g0158251 [Helianthus annuus]|uniref:DUF4283 domain-containing protein n=1 Tax=Helianthus annuus TaxID=4232 RepID=A0A9K3J657_HELAN|nr:hypothetical protein HanXRQr2_Chr04g0158251 [Helianthus annuus]
MNNELEDTRLEFIPPVVSPEGKKQVLITQDDLRYLAKSFALRLNVYFLGTSMDFKVVNSCFRRLWRLFELDRMSKSSAGFFFFKFKSESGMNQALENGPWMVNNVPVFFSRWEPEVCLEKIEPSVIPLWVTVQHVPLELWIGIGLSKILSGVGYPL